MIERVTIDEVTIDEEIWFSLCVFASFQPYEFLDVQYTVYVFVSDPKIHCVIFHIRESPERGAPDMGAPVVGWVRRFV